MIIKKIYIYVILVDIDVTRCEQCVYVEQGESETDQCLPATHRHQQPPV